MQCWVTADLLSCELGSLCKHKSSPDYQIVVLLCQPLDWPVLTLEYTSWSWMASSIRKDIPDLMFLHMIRIVIDIAQVKGG